MSQSVSDADRTQATLAAITEGYAVSNYAVADFGPAGHVLTAPLAALVRRDLEALFRQILREELAHLLPQSGVRLPAPPAYGGEP